MNKLRAIPAALACLFFAGAGNAMAEDYNPSWYIGGSIHAAETDEIFGAGNRGYGVGLRLGKPLSESWDAQINTNYTRASDNGKRYQQNALGIDLLYLFSRSTVRPYLVMGIAANRDRSNAGLKSGDSTSPAASGGVGVQLSLNDQWSAQAEWRKVHGYLHGNDFGFSQASNSHLSVGLNYSFDKPKVAARTVSFAPTPPPEPVMVQAPPPAPAPAPPPPVYQKITLSATELFAFDSAVLSTPQPKLDDIANALNANMQINQVVITGYADRLGSDKYNLNLSEQRANSVKSYLNNKGVATQRLNAIGKGESNPVVVCNNKKRVDLIACLEPNRRVEIEQFTVEQRVR
ncbi:OmpA family protein [Undibacterium umbellatum]|uniref:OmpA family protein n=1 Tax=Undibacterium umbellatum TaxID=2762300 RepID=A0ABR6ZHX6_9BURK|nr:OmpA family protein [Undibacterium umbellatum]MBC3911333.1 OmpA family protein [Undibacterium umbellatum]